MPVAVTKVDTGVIFSSRIPKISAEIVTDAPTTIGAMSKATISTATLTLGWETEVFKAMKHSI